MKNKLEILEEKFTIHRLPSDSTIPQIIFDSSFFSITKTDEELSIVTSDKIEIENSRIEDNWKCIKVVGPLEFSMIGLLADISESLAKNKISIFALSTYDTDYILVKEPVLEKAIHSLSNAGFLINK